MAGASDNAQNMVQGKYIDGVDISTIERSDHRDYLGRTHIDHARYYAHLMRVVSQMAAASAHAFECDNERDALEIMFRIKQKLEQ